MMILWLLIWIISNIHSCYTFRLSGLNEGKDLQSLQKLMDGFLLFENDIVEGKDWKSLSSNRYKSNQNKKPYFISIVFNENDISLTWEFIQLYNYEWSVFSAQKSHSWIGDWSVCNNCVVISLSSMNNLKVSSSNTLIVQPSIEHKLWVKSLEKYGLIIPPANCQTCVFGGWVQGGGFGFITQKFGLASDYIKSVRIMLYDGRFVEATLNNKYSDLLYAIKGGGANNFGIISEFQFNTLDIYADYPELLQVTRMQIWYIYDSSTVSSIFNIWSQLNSDKVTIYLYFFPVLDTSNPLNSYFRIRFTALYLGSGDDVDEFIDYMLDNTPPPTAVNIFNETLWNGLIGNMAPGFDRDRPGSSRLMTLNQRPSDDDIQYIIEQIDRSFELFEYNLSSTWFFYSRSRPNKQIYYSSYPWKKYPILLEIGFAPQWKEFDTIENREFVKQYANDMLDRFENDKLWYHTYTNLPDTDTLIKSTDRDWRYQYYGYIDNNNDDRYYSKTQNDILNQL
eukprot:29900_1